MGLFDGSGVRERELRETRAAWDVAERELARSPVGEHGVVGLALSLMSDLLQLNGRLPYGAIFDAIFNATLEVLELEEIGRVDPAWPVVERDVSAAVNLRKLIAHRRRWAAEFESRHTIVRKWLLPLWLKFLDRLPEQCFAEPDQRPTLADVPLVDLLHRPDELVATFSLFPFEQEFRDAGLFEELRARHGRNLLIASGFPAATNIATVRSRLTLPEGAASDLVERYLKGTPFASVFEVGVPIRIPDAVRFEHTHILGGTGHGKTQLLQRMIYADLAAAREDGRSVVVIDSQGDLIGKLVRLDLFDPDAADSLADRLVLIDPADVEHPAALNLFDAHLDRLRGYGPADRERVLNGAVEVYETLFGDMLGAELTQKQGVVFRYLARLMVTIPGATIRTLMQLMEDGRPFKQHMERLEGSARYFFDTEFFHPSFAATKKQILRRLWGVLSTPALERMFTQPTNRLDLFEATRDGKIILISTAKELLKREGSALVGRFFVKLLAQAALERSVLRPEERTPTFVYVDEAQEYFDESVETILQQARKYGMGLIVAHQSLDQASPKLRSSLLSNTSFKCAGGVSFRDARAVADELHTDAEFILGMRKRDDRTEFAAWVKNWTPQAIRLSVPLGYLERQPILAEEAYDALVARNRERYCGTYGASSWFSDASAPVGEADLPAEEAAPEPWPEPPVPRRRETGYRPMDFGASGPEKPPVRDLGKGGPKHRYLQNLVKGLAEQHGFRATIEAPMPGGQVDVLLERDDTAVAVEVSVTTPVEWERRNLRRCFDAGYARVALVLAKSQQTARRYREAVAADLSEEETARLAILEPDELPDFLASLVGAAEPDENVIKGYRVRVSRTEVSPAEAKARRDTLARLVAQSLRRQAE